MEAGGRTASCVVFIVITVIVTAAVSLHAVPALLGRCGWDVEVAVYCRVEGARELGVGVLAVFVSTPI